MQTARGPLSYVRVSMAGGWKEVWERRRNPGGSAAEALRENGAPQLGALPLVPTDTQLLSSPQKVLWNVQQGLTVNLIWMLKGWWCDEQSLLLHPLP